MELAPWGEWAAVAFALIVGCCVLYGKLRSLCTKVEGLSDSVNRNYEERLRIWERLDEHSVQIAKLSVKAGMDNPEG